MMTAAAEFGTRRDEAAAVEFVLPETDNLRSSSKQERD